MKQVFLSIPDSSSLDFEQEDGLPVSQYLLLELTTSFPEALKAQDPLAFVMTASRALVFLRDFYSRYELSQPQRRVKARFEKILAELPENQEIGFVAADVSERRSRRFAKKTK